MNQSIKYYLILWIVTNIHVQADNFIYEYFVYKGISRVTIFSCENFEEDFHLARRMNDLGIYINIAHPDRKNFNVSHHVVRRDKSSLGLFLDTRCQSREINEKIITQTTKLRLYASIHTWLIVGSSLDEIKSILNDDSYSLLTELTVAVDINNGYDLYDVYNPCKERGGSLNITRLGYWDPGNGFNITLTEIKFRRRSDLMGMRIKVVSVVKYKPPHQTVEEYLEDYATKSFDPISKYGWGIAQQIADLFNYTMNVTAVPEWIIEINGTEQGMMPMLDRGEVDIGLSPCSATMRYAAKPYGRLLLPGYPFRSFFIFRSNEVEKLKWMELMTPFAFDSWYAIFITAIFSIMIITTIQMTEYDEGWFSESGHAIFATIGVLCQQGLTFVPNRLAGRVAFLFLLFLGVLLSNYYGASVVSARLNEPPDKMNDSLYSLAKSHMTLTSEPYKYVDEILQFRSTFDWEVRYFNEKVWKKLGPSKFVKPEVGLAKVAFGGYAYHTSDEVAYPYIEENWDDQAICDMTEVHVVDPRILTFWERVESPFAEITKIGLIKSDNVGLRARTIKRWKPKVPYCSPDALSLKSITIFDIAPAVIIIFVGNLMAAMICCAETIACKFSPDRSDQRQQKKQRIVGKKTLLRTKQKN